MMKYNIVENPDALSKDEVIRLYSSNNWTNYTNDPDELLKAISNSIYVVACLDNDKLIGLARCISDDSSICYLQDILVDPDYHRKGVGTILMNKCHERFSHVRSHVLITDDQEYQKLFYEKHGYKNIKELIKVPLNCFVKMKNIDLE